MERPKLLPVDGDMQRWCAQIEAELATWPAVTARPMFGMVGDYRHGAIFAAIPRTRAVGTPYSMLLKLGRGTHARLRPQRVPGSAWVSFELHDADDIGQALEQLARAHDTVRIQRRRARR